MPSLGTLMNQQGAVTCPLDSTINLRPARSRLANSRLAPRLDIAAASSQSHSLPRSELRIYERLYRHDCPTPEEAYKDRIYESLNCLTSIYAHVQSTGVLRRTSEGGVR